MLQCKYSQLILRRRLLRIALWVRTYENGSDQMDRNFNKFG